MDKPHKEKGAEKTARIPVKIISEPPLPKPDWIRVRAAGHHSKFDAVSKVIKSMRMSTVCDEANCPNKGECYGKGTATFLILGDICTRRCPFCDVAHGRPAPVDVTEAERLAESVKRLGLAYVVITSVNRDDLNDGGAGHYAACVAEVRKAAPAARIEILTPDFRKQPESAIAILGQALPDVMNHNLETVPRLYKAARPGADYLHSLSLLKAFKEAYPQIPTKSGLMVGLGESDDELLQVMHDLREHGVDMLTIGQYLMPTAHHLPVRRYVTPEAFRWLAKEAADMGFRHAAIGPLVRSSYHADKQAVAAGLSA